MLMAILHAMRRLAWTVWSPSRAICEINERPTWLGAFLILAVCSATVSWITIPVLQGIPLAGIGQSLSEQDLLQLKPVNQLTHYLSVFSAFPLTMILWFLSTFLLWLIVQVFEGLPSFKSLFSVVAHANVVTAISSVLVAASVLIKATSGSVALEDLHIKLGLDLIWEDEHPALMVILASVNPFTLWHYGLLGAGISAICKFTAMRSGGVVALYWVMTSAFGAGIAWVGHAVIGGAT